MHDGGDDGFDLLDARFPGVAAGFGAAGAGFGGVFGEGGVEGAGEVFGGGGDGDVLGVIAEAGDVGGDDGFAGGEVFPELDGVEGFGEGGHAVRGDADVEGLHVGGDLGVGDGAGEEDVFVRGEAGEGIGGKVVGADEHEGAFLEGGGEVGEEGEVDAVGVDGAGVAEDGFRPVCGGGGWREGGVADLCVMIGIDAIGDEVEPPPPLRMRPLVFGPCRR